jgi:alanine-glyoxylate transaminase/serine-glyoxylate transaminase/serine-pyruvate transaminase
MTPPGLAFVRFGPRAAAARRRADPSPCRDRAPRANPAEFWHDRNGTAPPPHHLFGLAEALHMILREQGIAAVLARHARLARAVRAVLDVRGRAPGGAVPNIADPALRSHAVTAVTLAAPLGTALCAWLTARAGVTLGIGLGMAAPDDPARHRHARIGHMGHVTAHMILGKLGAVEAGMRALGIPLPPGGRAAAAEVVAGV